MILVSSCSCLCSIHWNQVLCGEWRCSWSRRCSDYIWVINNLIAHQGAPYIKGLTVVAIPNLCSLGNVCYLGIQPCLKIMQSTFRCVEQFQGNNQNNETLQIKFLLVCSILPFGAMHTHCGNSQRVRYETNLFVSESLLSRWSRVKHICSIYLTVAARNMTYKNRVSINYIYEVWNEKKQKNYHTCMCISIDTAKEYAYKTMNSSWWSQSIHCS